MRSKIFIIILFFLLTIFILFIISGKRENAKQIQESSQNTQDTQNSEAVPFSVGPSGPPVISEPTSPPPS